MQDWKPNPAKELLRGYRSLIRQRDALIQEIDDSYGRAYSCTAKIKPVYGSNIGAGDKVGEMVANAIDAQQSLQNAVQRVNEKIALILKAIELAETEPQREVLTLRYIRGLNWADIAEKMAYTDQWVFVLHGRALYIINQAMKDGKLPKN